MTAERFFVCFLRQARPAKVFKDPAREHDLQFGKEEEVRGWWCLQHNGSSYSQGGGSNVMESLEIKF